MAATKRKDAPSGDAKGVKKQKTASTPKAAKKPSKLELAADEEEFEGYSGDEAKGAQSNDKEQKKGKKAAKWLPPTADDARKNFKPDSSSTSAEAHAKQRALAKERKLSKPNADSIQRAKKLWERLRLKSHVQLEERKKLVAELFELINGRVRDFVFKHDSVRVIQCALKYANKEQRKSIVDELKDDVRTLVESRYGKFLVAKMVVEGDQEVRDIIVPQFYGHVKRLINHPEASWIVDDIYRQVASKQQKATLLREWYGAEFALFHRHPDAKAAATATHEETADLSEILKHSPEKRKPILQHSLQMINGLVQKKMTGFTMLHDAMLQYFLALSPGSSEHTEFMEILKNDVEGEEKEASGDLFKNLAFTKSGSRLMCLILAYGSAKDRKTIIRVFKDTVEAMAFDPYAKLVLVTALEVPDDTKMTAKVILHEYLAQHVSDAEERLSQLEARVIHLDARLPALIPMMGLTKSLCKDQDKAILEEVFAIRCTTSKKEPAQRQKELVEYLAAPCLELISQRASSLVESSFGCAFISDALLVTSGSANAEAKAAITQLAQGSPLEEGHIAMKPSASRMLKTLVTGGNFDPETKQVKLAQPSLGFGADLYPVIKDQLVEWACSDSSFVIVAFMESQDVPDKVKAEARKTLKKAKAKIESAAKSAGKNGGKGNAGAKILLGHLDS